MGKNIVYLSAIISFFVLVSCSDDAETNFKTVMDSAKSTDNGPGELLDQRSMEVTAEGDTINVKDQFGLKQGIWITNNGILPDNKGFIKDTTFYKDGVAQKKK
ncbi:MAG: hypothetical protein Q7W45_03415 [Bacteroidota bacterium]|nr:hypothetical protein [Bacteroidota bacterium]MDP3143852.1 hypothetical protein [Bacteroidota bacterium]